MDLLHTALDILAIISIFFNTKELVCGVGSLNQKWHQLVQSHSQLWVGKKLVLEQSPTRLRDNSFKEPLSLLDAISIRRVTNADIHMPHCDLETRRGAILNSVLQNINIG